MASSQADLALIVCPSVWSERKLYLVPSSPRGRYAFGLLIIITARLCFLCYKSLIARRSGQRVMSSWLLIASPLRALACSAAYIISFQGVLIVSEHIYRPIPRILIKGVWLIMCAQSVCENFGLATPTLPSHTH